MTRPLAFRAGQAGPLLSHVCVGLWATSFGPALPFFARDFGSSLDAAGLLLTALFAGSITASSVLAFGIPDTNSRHAAIVGLLTASAGLLVLAVAPSLWAGLAGGLLLGVGDGLVVASVHQLVADTAADIAGDINRLNVFFALGAIAGPLWAGLVLYWSDERWPVYAGIVAVACVAAWLLAGLPDAPPTKHSASGNDVSPDGNGPPVAVVAMASLLFLYVAAEIGLGSWVASYAKDAVGAGVIAGSVLTSLYWGALGAGRLISGALFQRGRAAPSVLVGSCAGALVASTVLVVTTGSLPAAIVAAVATGLCFGPIWPAAMATAAETERRTNTATLVTAGNAGGVVVPWAQGLVLVNAGAARGIAVTAALCAGMTLISGWFVAWKRSPSRRA